MKRILFLTPFAPSNKAGGENFTRLLLENLSVDFQIDLIYYRYADDPPYKCPNDNIKVVKDIVNSKIVKLKNWLCYPFIHPIFAIRFDRNVLALVRKLVNENSYDFLYLDHSQMALYGKYFPDMRKIMMSHDVMAQRFARSGGWLSRKLITAGEREMMSIPNTIVFSFSEKDRKIIKDTYGIDSRVTNFFLDESLVKAKPEKIERRIVFFGKWKRPDNFDGLKWFFDNVYNHLAKDIRISIIGKWMPDDFQNKIRGCENVEYLGFVEDPYPLIANSLATISPLFSGAGVKVKVVESLACGTPVIGGSIAFEGISSNFKDFMINADTPEEYADRINNMDISLEARCNFKQNFLDNYQRQLISTYINTL